MTKTKVLEKPCFSRRSRSSIWTMRDGHRLRVDRLTSPDHLANTNIWEEVLRSSMKFNLLRTKSTCLAWMCPGWRKAHSTTQKVPRVYTPQTSPNYSNKPMWKPQQPRWTSIQANRSKNGALYQKWKYRKKRKHHLEPLFGALKTFKPLCFNIYIYRAIFLKPLNLYVRPVSGTFVWNLLTLMWNLDPKPLCGTYMRNL